MYQLSVQERDTLFATLNLNQQDFLKNQMIRSRRTAFANAMAKAKGFHIPHDAEYEDIEHLLNDWVYVGYIDAGQVTPELKCECGRSLRYQHHVEHKISGEVMKFGIDHLKEHLNIDASIVAAIKKGLDAVDFELDEVLIKVRGNWRPDPEILYHQDLTDEALEMIKLDLPLLDRHISRLRMTRRVHSHIPMQKEQVIDSSEFDLFTFDQVQSRSRVKVIGDVLDDRLHGPVREYIARGIRSARTICELLIREHAAADDRFLTGKPKIYYSVCLFIEEDHPDINVVDLGRADRHYTYNK